MIKRFLFLITFLFTTLFVSTVMAGVVNVNDTMNVVSEQEKGELIDLGKGLPFDTYISVTGAYDSKEALDSYLETQLTVPTMIVIGLDPTHRRTVVRFGNETKIDVENFNTITKSGDPYFKNKQWAKGLGSIMKKSGESVGVAVSYSTPMSASTFFLWFFGLSAGGLLVWLTVRALIRAKRAKEELDHQFSSATPSSYDKSNNSVASNPAQVDLPVVKSTPSYSSPDYTRDYSRSYSRPSISSHRSSYTPPKSSSTKSSSSSRYSSPPSPSVVVVPTPAPTYPTYSTPTYSTPSYSSNNDESNKSSYSYPSSSSSDSSSSSSSSSSWSDSSSSSSSSSWSDSSSSSSDSGSSGGGGSSDW